MMVMMAKLMTMTYIMTMFKIIDDQDDDCDYMTINHNHGYGKNFELNHTQDFDMSKSGDYDNDDKIDDNGDVHIDLEGPLGS